MNALETYLSGPAGLTETKAMNQLQENSVVSDNCVAARDVADADCLRAVKWLKMQGGLL